MVSFAAFLSMNGALGNTRANLYVSESVMIDSISAQKLLVSLSEKPVMRCASSGWFPMLNDMKKHPMVDLPTRGGVDSA